MLPYYLMILPSWICLAILLPLVQTFHALQHESADRKLWLFYWCLYCVASIFLYYFEWLICIPFYVISFYVDIYYETQLLVIFWLVYPKTLGIKNLQAYDVLLIENICCAYTSLRIRVILPASMIGRVYWQK